MKESCDKIAICFFNICIRPIKSTHCELSFNFSGRIMIICFSVFHRLPLPHHVCKFLWSLPGLKLDNINFENWFVMKEGAKIIDARNNFKLQKCLRHECVWSVQKYAKKFSSLGNNFAAVCGLKTHNKKFSLLQPFPAYNATSNRLQENPHKNLLFIFFDADFLKILLSNYFSEK